MRCVQDQILLVTVTIEVGALLKLIDKERKPIGSDCSHVYGGETYITYLSRCQVHDVQHSVHLVTIPVQVLTLRALQDSKNHYARSKLGRVASQSEIRRLGIRKVMEVHYKVVAVTVAVQVGALF